ncbi:sh3 domain-binding protein 5 [Holotrichia oblita]|uniref:Sh3 domain-binding protein 5 n=1 Tax=Holotrichia oblita TaxID=644536 RepID=A0ACB9T4L5_HOLOL|nr:sh3 domain-binding protein 5 [Holotrichia oblita]
MDAENQKAESGREHQRRAALFNAAEQKVQHLEDRLRRHVIKSRPYFEEKALCQDQLNTQKDRIETLKQDICKVKCFYSQSLKNLEYISNEIHMKRNSLNLTCLERDMLNSPREPGVGAELSSDLPKSYKNCSLPDYKTELDKCEIRSVDSCSGTTSSAVSEKDITETVDEEYLDELKLKVKELAVRPIEGGEGQSTDGVWENELKNTVDKLDHIMLMKECAQNLIEYKTELHNKSPKRFENMDSVRCKILYCILYMTYLPSFSCFNNFFA